MGKDYSPMGDVDCDLAGGTLGSNGAGAPQDCRGRGRIPAGGSDDSEVVARPVEQSLCPDPGSDDGLGVFDVVGAQDARLESTEKQDGVSLEKFRR